MPTKIKSVEVCPVRNVLDLPVPKRLRQPPPADSHASSANWNTGVTEVTEVTGDCIRKANAEPPLPSRVQAQEGS